MSADTSTQILNLYEKHSTFNHTHDLFFSFSQRSFFLRFHTFNITCLYFSGIRNVSIPGLYMERIVTALKSNINNKKFQHTTVIFVRVQRIRTRPIWLHLITIFFTKRMFHSALKYGLVGTIMFRYTKLGFWLLILSAFLSPRTL